MSAKRVYLQLRDKPRPRHHLPSAFPFPCFPAAAEATVNFRWLVGEQGAYFTLWSPRDIIGGVAPEGGHVPRHAVLMGHDSSTLVLDQRACLIICLAHSSCSTEGLFFCVEGCHVFTQVISLCVSSRLLLYPLLFRTS